MKLNWMLKVDPIREFVSNPTAPTAPVNVTVNGADGRPSKRLSKKGLVNPPPPSILNAFPGTIGDE
jgi:hypothetical protein